MTAGVGMGLLLQAVYMRSLWLCLLSRVAGVVVFDVLERCAECVFVCIGR
jgi:hypothetical protein